MANNFRFAVEGFEDIEKVLHALGKNLGAQVLTQVLRNAAKPLIQEAKRLAPVDDGGLKKSIGALRAKETSISGFDGPQFTGIFIGPRRGFYEGHHAHLVEFGTGPRKLDKPATIKIGNRWVTITHTGSMPAKPFMRPAYDAKIGEVQKEVAKRLFDVLESDFKGVFK